MLPLCLGVLLTQAWCACLPHLYRASPFQPPPEQGWNATDCGSGLQLFDGESFAEALSERCGNATAVATNGGSAVSHADTGSANSVANGSAAAVAVTRPGSATAVAVAGPGGKGAAVAQAP